MSIFHKKPSLEELNTHWLSKLEYSLGVKFTAISENSISLEFCVGEGIIQPHGILHGGFSCVIGESLGSVAGHLALRDPDKVVVGQNLQAMHIRSAPAATLLTATVEALHIGRRSQIWETLIREQANQRLIAKITLTVAVIDRQSKS